MPTSSVKEFAELVAIPVDRLLRQLEDAGVAGKDAADVITDDEKNELLGYLRRSHGVAEGDPSGKPKKIVLKRTVTGELRQASSTRRKTSGLAAQTNKVKLVVKRRRTYVKRTEIEGEPTEEQTRPDETQPLTQVEAAAASEPVVATLVPATDVVAARETEQPVPGADRPNLGQAPAQVSDPSAEVPAGRSAAQPARQLPRSPKPDLKPGTPPKGPFTRGKGKTEDRDSRRDKALRDIKVSRKRSKGRAGEQTPKSAARHQFEMPAEAQKKEVRVGDAITVADLANRMSVKAAEVIKALMGLGQMVTINQTLDQDTAILVVEEMGHRAVAAPDENPELLLTSPEAAVGTPRAPVVTVMGHVDHGKTSLLDYIRKTRVAAGESGGITQHIGAYHVVTANGPITFLDTPGHEAFSAMRARGARVTDVVVLVVAADDGVMPQTQEAIEHARASQVPVIVAINKIDKPQADVAKVKQDLVGRGLVPEEWGGDTLFVEVSAKTGAGIDTLLESLALQAEILELVAPAEGPAEGVVIESRLDRGRGPVATVLIQKGCLKKGDIVLAGQVYGRARMIFDAKGETQQDAGPSMPIEIQGLSGIPNVGDPVNVVVDERRAREIAEYRGGRAREANLTARIDGPSEDIFSQLREQRIKVLNIIVKADVQGSVEALAEALRRLSNEEVAVKVVASGVGGIIETDVNLAISTGSLLIGFNVRADATARRMIQAHGVELRYYSVIYEAIDEVKAALGGMLEPEIRQQIIGLAEVRDVFHSKKLGAIAGCVVVEGSVRRNSPIRVLRDNVVIFEGQLESLRRIKDDVGEVKSGTECGIGVKDYNDVRIGDQIECFEVVRVERKI